MSDVVRLDMPGDDGGGMCPHGEGDYVAYADYESLQSQLAAANERADGLQRTINEARKQEPVEFRAKGKVGHFLCAADYAGAEPLYAAPVPAQPAVVPEGCVCHGSWREIVAEAQPLFNTPLQHTDGNACRLQAVALADDDYYYIVKSGDKVRWLSCVGSLESWGVTAIISATEGRKDAN